MNFSSDSGPLGASHESVNRAPSSVTELLDEMRHLLELSGENPFRIRAFEKASSALAEREDLLERARNGTLREIPGIGQGIEEILKEFLLHSQWTALEQLRKSIPPGLLELTQIPGLGPKKARTLIEELGIQSIGELEYACKENRLIRLKGFGEKIQKKILESIALQSSYQGFRKLSDVWQNAEQFYRDLIQEFPGLLVSETGALRRRCEVLRSLEFIVGLDEASVQAAELRATIQSFVADFVQKYPSGLPFEIHFVQSSDYIFELARTTSSPMHWAAIGSPEKTHELNVTSEEEFYQNLGLNWIPPEGRETGEEVELSRAGQLDDLLPWSGVRGVFHNHTVKSDGAATLEQMVTRAEELGFEYIGISDHSQSAVYAQGLRTDILEEQYREVQEVQARHPRVRIFWGIESDILADGSLDYDTQTLQKFDFVIASIHSRFNMDRDAMTQRIVKAIRHPATRFLGHPTGRLLLGRKGYEVDMEAIIEEAARCGVAVELNANPNRLDLDWRWGPQMRKYRTVTSINPDAHDLAGLEDVRYGIAMARKALLPASQVLNSKPVREVEAWLKRQ
jgi:DNA polymerase (family 10)